MLHWVTKVWRLLGWQKSPCECPTTSLQLPAPEQLLNRNTSHKQQDHLFWRLETEILFLGNIQYFKAHSYVFHKMSFSSFSNTFEPIHIFQWEQGWWIWVPVPISDSQHGPGQNRALIWQLQWDLIDLIQDLKIFPLIYQQESFFHNRLCSQIYKIQEYQFRTSRYYDKSSLFIMNRKNH